MSYSPAALLGELGIPILSVPLRDTWGAWSPIHRKIVIAAGLAPLHRRCILAHEAEHVLAGDGACGFGLLTEWQEQRADLEAARKLITLRDLVEITRQEAWGRAALLLGVTDHMLQIRLADLQEEGWPWPATSKTAG